MKEIDKSKLHLNELEIIRLWKDAFQYFFVYKKFVGCSRCKRKPCFGIQASNFNKMSLGYKRFCCGFSSPNWKNIEPHIKLQYTKLKKEYS